MTGILSLARANDVVARLRQRAGAVVVDGFFHGIASAGRLLPPANPERHNVEVLHDIPYLASDAIEHRLDIYRPTNIPGPYPVVLYVHGGGFRILSKDSHWLMGLIFARRGYLVANISYRLAPEFPYPCAVEDACAAFDWVVGNAERYGGDASRIVLAGESAGANLVTSLALALSYEREEEFAKRVWSLGVTPRAVVPACGMFQVSDPGRFRRRKRKLPVLLNDRLVEVADAYLSAWEGQPPERLDFADPVVALERGRKPDRPLPPFFVSVGTKDPLLDDTRRLKRALDQLGVECEARFYPGEIHAFHAFVWRKSALRCWQETFEFLERHLRSEETHRAPD